LASVVIGSQRGYAPPLRWRCWVWSAGLSR